MRAAHAYREVLAKGYFDRVQTVCAGKEIAQHERHWGREETVLDPLHCLPLLERKPGALDWCLPLAAWDSPDCFRVLRAGIEHQFGDEGTWEFIRVLRPLDGHSVADLSRAIECALRCNALFRDAIAQFLIPREDWRQQIFRLDGREHLRHVRVATTDVLGYAESLAGGDSR